MQVSRCDCRPHHPSLTEPGLSLILTGACAWRRDVTNWLITEQLPRDNASLFLGDLGLQYEAGLRTQIARIARLFPTLPVLAMHTSVPFSYSRHVQVPSWVLTAWPQHRASACAWVAWNAVACRNPPGKTNRR